MAEKTIERFLARAIPLFEQESEGANAPSDLESTCSNGSEGCITAEHSIQKKLTQCWGTLSKMVHAALSQIGPTDSVTQS